MPTFERYLTVRVFLCIVVGVALGHVIPGVFQAIGTAEVAKVNLPVAVRIWLMIIPMLLKIDFASLNQVGCHWRGIGVTLFINWAVKPFPMALLGWLFVGYLFRPYLPVDQIDSCIAGLIILAVAKGREQVPRSWRMSASKAPGRSTSRCLRRATASSGFGSTHRIVLSPNHPVGQEAFRSSAMRWNPRTWLVSRAW